jgi:hypothetical protein
VIKIRHLCFRIKSRGNPGKSGRWGKRQPASHQQEATRKEYSALHCKQSAGCWRSIAEDFKLGRGSSDASGRESELEKYVFQKDNTESVLNHAAGPYWVGLSQAVGDAALRLRAVEAEPLEDCTERV